MRKIALALAASALAFSSAAANASVTLGSTSATSGTATAVVTDNIGNPNKIEFDTTNASAGTVVSWFNFLVTPASLGAFSATTATIPASSVTLLELLTGGTMTTAGSTLVTSTPGTQLTYGTLAANTWYTFRYTANLTTASDISGPVSIYAVPEPGTWALMLVGFGGIGLAMRRRRRPVLAQVA
jgi:hypothetical protein